MSILEIDPGNIPAFGNHDDHHFCVVTNKEIESNISVHERGGFLSYIKCVVSKECSLEKLLATDIPEKACVVVISPYVLFQSPPQESLGKRRLIAMACNSTPTDMEDIVHFWDCVTNTDHAAQEKRTEDFFAVGENAEYLRFVDPVNGTDAKFMHLHESYLWSEQTGILNDGEQQLAPAGEISVLPLDIQNFDENLRLDFNGTIALHGIPILHSGTPSFTRKDQKRVHDRLSSMSKSAVIATVENGEIINIAPSTPESQQASDMLENMFCVDSRYRILWEIGFAINNSLVLRDGNHAMNEIYGGDHGAIHFGLGLTPHTQYHLDIICPRMNVLTESNVYLIGTGDKGKPKINARKNSSAGCVCLN